MTDYGDQVVSVGVIMLILERVFRLFQDFLPKRNGNGHTHQAHDDALIFRGAALARLDALEREAKECVDSRHALRDNINEKILKLAVEVKRA